MVCPPRIDFLSKLTVSAVEALNLNLGLPKFREVNVDVLSPEIVL